MHFEIRVSSETDQTHTLRHHLASSIQAIQRTNKSKSKIKIDNRKMRDRSWQVGRRPSERQREGKDREQTGWIAYTNRLHTTDVLMMSCKQIPINKIMKNKCCWQENSRLSCSTKCKTCSPETKCVQCENKYCAFVSQSFMHLNKCKGKRYILRRGKCQKLSPLHLPKK